MGAARFVTRRARYSALLAGLVLAAFAARLPAAEISGLVVAVHDGDTITVRTAVATIHVRVAAIDAPELDQPFGQAARRFTDNLVYHQIVTLRTLGVDQYGRTLAFVLLPDGRVLERELLAAGYAWQYRFFSADGDLRALEEDARAARRGLWEDVHPLPPWGWRRVHRDASP